MQVNHSLYIHIGKTHICRPYSASRTYFFIVNFMSLSAINLTFVSLSMMWAIDLVWAFCLLELFA